MDLEVGAHVHTARHLLVFLLLLAFLSMVHTRPECQAVQPLLVLAGLPGEERLLEEGTMLSLTCPVAAHSAYNSPGLGIRCELESWFCHQLMEHSMSSASFESESVSCLVMSNSL